MKRVVTEIASNRKSVFKFDAKTPHFFSGGGFEVGSIWSTSGVVDVVSIEGDAAEGKQGTVPAEGETLCMYCVIPPLEEIAEKDVNNGDADPDFNVEGDDLMHTTDSVDYGVIVEGELYLQLDDGEERLLRAGDSFVQNGTRHAWYNRSKQPATMFVVMVGAARG